jgi:2-dehydropantoate 2-reductase
MKICIYGAGAIGGYLGVQLLRAGADVTLVARGAHLAAMRERGLKLLIGDEARVVRPRCTDNPAELGPQDFVIVCLKAHSITGVIEAMQPLLGARTRIVTAVNGIPYWYFYRHGGRFEDSTLQSIDPGGRQWRELTPQRAIGCIVYPATEIEAPGVIRHVYGDRLASRRAKSAPMLTGFPRCSTPRECRRRCSIASVTKSGSSFGAMSASIRFRR